MSLRYPNEKNNAIQLTKGAEHALYSAMRYLDDRGEGTLSMALNEVLSVVQGVTKTLVSLELPAPTADRP